MEFEAYDPGKHYFEMMQAWTQRGLPAVPPEFLPPTGLRVVKNGSLLCGGFLVKSDTAVACVSFLYASPLASKTDRSEALDLLILKLSELAQQGGFTVVAASSNVPPLMARYARLGFKITDSNVTCFAGEI